MKTLTSPHHYLNIVIIFCVTILITSYILENCFGIHPCQLCLYERYGFIFAAIIALSSRFLLSEKNQSIFLIIMCLFFLGEAFLAGYHVAVQQQLIQPPTFCIPPVIDMSGSFESVTAQILNTPAVRCDIINWQLFGLSLAAYNVLLSIGLSLFCFIGFIRNKS